MGTYFRSDAALFPNYFRQTCYVCMINMCRSNSSDAVSRCSSERGGDHGNYHSDGFVGETSPISFQDDYARC